MADPLPVSERELVEHGVERLILAAVNYVDLYAEDLAAQPEGGTSRELLAAVHAVAARVF